MYRNLSSLDEPPKRAPEGETATALDILGILLRRQGAKKAFDAHCMKRVRARKKARRVQVYGLLVHSHDASVVSHAAGACAANDAYRSSGVTQIAEAFVKAMVPMLHLAGATAETDNLLRVDARVQSEASQSAQIFASNFCLFLTSYPLAKPPCRLT